APVRPLPLLLHRRAPRLCEPRGAPRRQRRGHDRRRQGAARPRRPRRPLARAGEQLPRRQPHDVRAERHARHRRVDDHLPEPAAPPAPDRRRRRRQHRHRDRPLPERAPPHRVGALAARRAPPRGRRDRGLLHRPLRDRAARLRAARRARRAEAEV
ncbi:MAG: hypothetical protein AVDCRST_MAG40-2743, partial [uncultured Gemmatimonadaceae bacterium]